MRGAARCALRAIMKGGSRAGCGGEVLLLSLGREVDKGREREVGVVVFFLSVWCV